MLFLGKPLVHFREYAADVVDGSMGFRRVVHVGDILQIHRQIVGQLVFGGHESGAQILLFQVHHRLSAVAVRAVNHVEEIEVRLRRGVEEVAVGSLPATHVDECRHIVEERPHAIERFVDEHALSLERRQHLTAAAPQFSCGIVEQEGKDVISLNHRLCL